MEGLIWGVAEQVVKQVLKRMKVGKAPWPTAVISYFIQAGVKGLFQVFESIEQEGEVPEPYHTSI